MTILYPPVLDNKGKSIPAYVDTSAGDATFDLYFTLPNSIKRSDIQHIQVSMKYYENGQFAINEHYAPDLGTMFLNTNNDSFNFHKVTGSDDLYVLRINYECFKSGGPIEQRDYSVQVRFGAAPLWAGAPLVDGSDIGATRGNHWARNIDGYDFTGFSLWRKGEVNKNPSGFGEWSNSQRVHCHSSMSLNLAVSFEDFTPIVTCEFSPIDPTETVAQVEFTYSYYNL